MISLKYIYLWLFLVLPIELLTQTGENIEYKVKAAYLERFTRFIEWPEETALSDTNQEFILGIIGKSPFESILEEDYAKQKIKNHYVQIREISDIKEISSCHILFICESENENLQNILAKTKTEPVLTIGDTEGYAQKGVLINMFLDSNKIRFEINYKAVQQSGLRISYKLLNVAKIVDSSEEQ